jgi:hypothetical protein
MQGPFETYKLRGSGRKDECLEILGRRSISPDPEWDNKTLAKLYGWEGRRVWRGNLLVRGVGQEGFEGFEGI